MRRFAALITLILLGICLITIQSHLSQAETGNLPNTTITVFGEAKLSAKPNMAVICLGVETESKNVTQALNENSEKLNRIISAIEELGIPEDNITTTYFRVYPVRDYKTNEFKGYRVVNEIKIRTGDLGGIGKIVSVAISSGANRVEWIEFGLGEDKVRELRIKAIREACKDAKTKAETIAESLNLTIVRLLNVKEQSAYFQPYKVYGSELGAVPMPTVAVPPIKPGEVKVSFKIVATFIAQ